MYFQVLTKNLKFFSTLSLNSDLKCIELNVILFYKMKTLGKNVQAERRVRKHMLLFGLEMAIMTKKINVISY